MNLYQAPNPKQWTQRATSNNFSRQQPNHSLCVLLFCWCIRDYWWCLQNSFSDCRRNLLGITGNGIFLLFQWKTHHITDREKRQKKIFSWVHYRTEYFFPAFHKIMLVTVENWRQSRFWEKMTSISLSLSEEIWRVYIDDHGDNSSDLTKKKKYVYDVRYKVCIWANR